MTLLRQPINNRRLAGSIAMLEGEAHGAVGHRWSTLSWCASILSTRLSSSRLSYTNPLPSVAAYSGLPPRATVPATLPVAASIAVALLLPPLKANTREVAGWKMIASGFLPVGTSEIGLRVFRSKIVTLDDWPLLVNPRPRS